MDYKNVIEIAVKSGVQVNEHPNAISTISDVSSNLPTFRFFVENLLKEFEKENKETKPKPSKEK